MKRREERPAESTGRGITRGTFDLTPPALVLVLASALGSIVLLVSGILWLVT